MKDAGMNDKRSVTGTLKGKEVQDLGKRELKKREVKEKAEEEKDGTGG